MAKENSNNGILAPMTKRRFLSKPNEVGVVAVGFAGGQVC